MTDSTVETREVDPEDDKEVVTFKKTIASFNRVCLPLLKVMMRLRNKKGRRSMRSLESKESESDE